jgi:Dolichyl-phosphate-mannose-protein mannosyltransferase
VTSEGHSSTSLPKHRRVEIVLVTVLLAGFVAAVTPSLRQPLLGNHGFRQTQTAYTARIYHEQGIDLIHPKLPVLGAPFEVPFEFPLFQAAASLLMDVGVRDDVAMRIMGLLCFLGTAVLLYGLVRHVAGRASAVAALIAFVATPFAVVWGRASLIEYLATAGAVGFTWATISWRENRRIAVAALALAAGLVAMLVKPMTAAFWIVPALAYRPARPRFEYPRWRGAVTWAALVLLPFTAAALWTRHADQIKAASPTTAWLTSDALTQWNYGTTSQRLDSNVWSVIADRVVADVVGVAGVALIAVAAIAVVRSRQRWFWLGIALIAVLPPLVFTNLYFVHDYYLAAISPSLAALIGLGAGFVWKLLPPNSLVKSLAVLAGALLASTPLVFGDAYWKAIYVDNPDPHSIDLAREVDELTRADEPVGVVGLDWSPAVLYYAKRWGLMVVERNADLSYEALHREAYRHLLVAYPSDTDLSPLARWRWLGALGPQMYGIADAPDELPGARFVATDGQSPPEGPVVGRGLRIRCGETTGISSGKRGTLIRVSQPSPTTQVTVSAELAPLPARRMLFVAPELATAGVVPVTCSGRPSILVDVFDVPSPVRS